MTVNVLTPIAAAEAQTSSSTRTRTPIKHLIVVVGENHSFDNVFATYTPPDPTQSVWNLLSQGIVTETGAPGMNAAKASQREATDYGTYQLAPPKSLLVSLFLPQPNTTLSAIPFNPCLLGNALTVAGLNPSGPQQIYCSDPGLLPADQLKLSNGGTGQPLYLQSPTSMPPISIFPVADCRYPSMNSLTPLPNAPYSIVGASVIPSNCQPLPYPPFIFGKPGGGHANSFQRQRRRSRASILPDVAAKRL